MDHAGHRDRLRKRFQAEGLGGFAPHEILELLLTYAIPRIDVNPLAHRLLNHFGSLEAVLEASVEELTHVEGIGEKAASFLSMLLPVFRAYEMEKKKPRLKIKNHGDLVKYCRSLFVGEKNEQLYLLCFDAQMQLKATTRIASGTPDEVLVLPRQMMQAVMRHNAVFAVMTHNHPSGMAEPSAADQQLTMNIENMLKSVEIRLTDHIIIAGENAYSFFLDGMLGQPAIRDSELYAVESQDNRQAADRQEVRRKRAREQGEWMNG